MASVVNASDDKPPAPRAQQHRSAHEAGVPKTAEERREARRAFMLKHRGAYEVLARS